MLPVGPERPIVVEPAGTGLWGFTLRYAHEVRDEADYFTDIPQMNLPDEMLRITEHILESKTESFDPEFLEDRYRTVLVEKLREKQRQAPGRKASTPSRENVINLMDALKRSLAAEHPPARRSMPKPTSGRVSVAAKRTRPKRSPTMRGSG